MGRDAVRHLLDCSLRNIKDCDECLLGRLLEQLRTLKISRPLELRQRRELASAIESLIGQGYSLRSHLPHVPPGLHEEWLGRRLILGHARWFWAGASWTSIVSSRLGRNGRMLADWPALLELLLRSIRRTGSLYLSVSDTTVARLVEPVLARSAVPHVRVRLPAPAQADVAAWLAETLSAFTEQQTGKACELHFSPSLSAACDQFQELPLQDRIAICCAQRVRVLLVRQQGTIAHLLGQRLGDPRFGAGSVSVLLPHGNAGRARRAVNSSDAHANQLAWLERGAVGWYVLPREPHGVGLGCRRRSGEGARPLWQLTSKYALWAAGRAPPPEDRLPRYLVHCVRGAQGALPPDAAASVIVQSWIAAHVADESPLTTLASVLESGVLRGRAALNRAQQACVSFSGVPLDELVQRRAFQSHLGRWDWEPFGLMIERRALERLGAQPVIYGDSETYRQLNPQERPLFQPARRRRVALLRSGWSEEREWRFMGDLRLSQLPRWAVAVFVAAATQAQALARHSRWPVIWLEDAQTREQPSGSTRRSRRGVRTGKN